MANQRRAQADDSIEGLPEKQKKQKIETIVAEDSEDSEAEGTDEDVDEQDRRVLREGWKDYWDAIQNLQATVVTEEGQRRIQMDFEHKPLHC